MLIGELLPYWADWYSLVLRWPEVGPASPPWQSYDAAALKTPAHSLLADPSTSSWPPSGATLSPAAAWLLHEPVDTSGPPQSPYLDNNTLLLTMMCCQLWVLQRSKELGRNSGKSEQMLMTKSIYLSVATVRFHFPVKIRFMWGSTSASVWTWFTGRKTLRL